MTIYVIDDHPLMREAMTMMLRRMRPGATVIDVSTLEALEGAIREHGEPELFCLDLMLPDVNGMEGIQKVSQRYPGVALAVVSSNSSMEFEERCIQAGAHIFLEKTLNMAEMSAALRVLLSPEALPDPATLGEGPTPVLSRRQQELLVMMEQGLTNREIGEKLGISEHTIKVHLWRLFKRLEVKSRTQALNYARTHGLLAR